MSGNWVWDKFQELKLIYGMDVARTQTILILSDDNRFLRKMKII